MRLHGGNRKSRVSLPTRRAAAHGADSAGSVLVPAKRGQAPMMMTKAPEPLGGEPQSLPGSSAPEPGSSSDTLHNSTSSPAPAANRR
jgi:hypothetical protein